MITAEKIMYAMNGIDGEFIREADALPRKKRRYFRVRYFIAAAAAVLTLSFSMAAVSGSEELYYVLYSRFPALAQSLKSVNKVSRDNGVEMEVISAEINNSTARVLFSVSDDKNRIDTSLDLFDSYYINCPFDSASHVALSRFDEETGTAYFLAEIERTDGKPINGGKVTFGVRELIFGKKHFSGIIDGISLGNICEDPETMSVSEFTGGGYRDEMPDFAAYRYLVPFATADFSPVSGVRVSGAAYFDDALHIQVCCGNTRKHDNHGHISLMDKNGGIIDAYEKYGEFSASFRYGDSEDSFTETIIAVPREELSDYALYGEFFTSEGYIEGDWKVTFRLEGSFKLTTVGG